VSFTEPSRESPVKQQASYDSVLHQLQSTWHWTHHPNHKNNSKQFADHNENHLLNHCCI